MSPVQTLLMILIQLNVHGTEKQCEELIKPIAHYIVDEMYLRDKAKPPTSDGDIAAAKTFYKFCKTK